MYQLISRENERMKKFIHRDLYIELGPRIAIPNQPTHMRIPKSSLCIVGITANNSNSKRETESLNETRERM
jgi:hypothetical protein